MTLNHVSIQIAIVEYLRQQPAKVWISKNTIYNAILPGISPDDFAEILYSACDDEGCWVQLLVCNEQDDREEDTLDVDIPADTIDIDAYEVKSR